MVRPFDKRSVKPKKIFDFLGTAELVQLVSYDLVSAPLVLRANSSVSSINRKGAIAGIGFWLTILIVGAIVFIIFFLFMTNAAGQTQPLYQKGIEATGELPCFKPPTISIPRVTFIVPTSEQAIALGSSSQIVQAVFTANVRSDCFENLSVTWDFNDGTVIETECQAPYDAGNCSLAMHNYTLPGIDALFKGYDVSASAFGTRSAYFVQKNTIGFVADPNFRFISANADSGDFSCIRIDATLSDTRSDILGGAPPLTRADFEVEDNFKASFVESLFAANNIFSFAYRAETPGTHSAAIRANQGFQTISTELDYKSPPISASFPEIVVLGEPGDLSIYNRRLEPAIGLNGKFFPDASTETDLSVGDVDSDRISDLVFLKTSGASGDIFAQTYVNLLQDLDAKVDALPIESLRRVWPNFKLDALSGRGFYVGSNPEWKAVAAGENIRSPDGRIGNIVVLGNPGDLDLYKGSASAITQIERGKEFKDFVVRFAFQLEDHDVNFWQDVAAFDVDNDGEDEVIALFGGTHLLQYAKCGDDRSACFGDLFIFKYKDYKKVNNVAEFDCRNGRQGFDDAPSISATGQQPGMEPCWVNIDAIPVNGGQWIAVAAGELEKSEFADGPEIVAIGEPGDLVRFSYDRNAPGLPVTSYLWNRDWPDEPEWLDITTADLNKDGIDELLFLYKLDNEYFIAQMPYENIPRVNSLDTFRSSAAKVIKLQAERQWQAFAAGDFGCLL